MTDSTIDMVRADLEFNLNRLNDALRRGDLPLAQTLLAQLQEQIVPGNDLYAKLELSQRELNRIQRTKVRALEESVKSFLGAGDVDGAEQALDLLGSLVPKHPNLEQWRARLGEIILQKRQAEQLAHFESDLRRRWAEAEDAENAGLRGSALSGIYSNIFDDARVQADKINLPRARGLAQDAQRRYNEVRARHEIPSTRQQEGRYKDILDDLRQRRPDEIVQISRDRIDLAGSLESISAIEAIKLIEIQARDLAAEKASKYRDGARKFIEEHAPYAARDELAKALDLFMLDEEERQKVLHLQDTQVQPALAARQVAEAKLRQAEGQSPFRAWELVAEARKTDPYVPNLAEVRQGLLERIRRDIGERLDAAEKVLSDGRPDHVTATRLAMEVSAAARNDEALQGELQRSEDVLRQAEQWQRMEAEIKTAIADAEQVMTRDPRSAYEGLQTRKAAWGERGLRFSELRELEAQLVARVNISVLLAELQRALANPVIEDVAQALAEAEAAIKADPPRKSELMSMRDRLRMHQNYLRAAETLQKRDRTAADEQTALELLRTVSGNADDAAKARELELTIRQDQAATDEAKRRLASAEKLRAAGRYEAAYDELKSVSQHPIVTTGYAQLVSEWEGVLIRGISDALAEARLHEIESKRLVSRLEMLGSAQASSLRTQVYGRSAAQRAQDLMSGRTVDWDAIVAAWDEALEADPGNPEYQEKHHAADKSRTFSQLPADAHDRMEALSDLVERYPSDLEVRVWHIDAALAYLESLQRYDEIDVQAHRIRETILRAKQMAEAAKAPRQTQREFERRLEALEALVDIAQRRNEIERLLKPERLVDGWKRARIQAEQLLANYADRPKLRSWWRQLRDGAFNEAQTRLAKCIDTGAEVWDAIQPAAQILVLEPDHVTARQQIQQVYQAIMVLEQKLGSMERDKTGAGYGGEPSTILQKQLDEVDTVYRRLNLAEQVLLNFGGQFANVIKLREQVSGLKDRNELLRERLERLQRYANNAEVALSQARSQESLWYSFDEQRNLINQLGYGSHLAIVALDERKDETKKKQAHLKDLRDGIERAVRDGDVGEARRKIELMVGTTWQSIVTAKASSWTSHVDPLADPTDDFGEQARLRVTEPYTRRTFAGLRSLVTLLQEQSQQIDLLLAWLPSWPVSMQIGNPVPPSSALQVRQPLLTWTEVEPAVESEMKTGAFQSARDFVQLALEGEKNSLYQRKLALNPANTFLSQPPINEADLNSREAQRLWDHGRALLASVQRDIAIAQRKQGEIDRLETDWKDAYARFMSAVEAVSDLQARSTFVRWRRAEELRTLKVQARTAYTFCEQLCPGHPDLVGWVTNPLLG